jgi:predicted metal-dependent enzyme (double-stranded beta helix superfamily)
VRVVRPRGRDLLRAELKTLVEELADRPERWRHLLEHDTLERSYVQLLRDVHLDVWAIAWVPDNDTGFHDHDVSSGAVAVVEGAVREDRLLLGGGTTSRRYDAGSAFTFAASQIHRVTHEAGAPAVTVHAYSPPLWRMGAYEIGADGELARHAVSYAEELRPLSPV